MPDIASPRVFVRFPGEMVASGFGGGRGGQSVADLIRKISPGADAVSLEAVPAIAIAEADEASIERQSGGPQQIDLFGHASSIPPMKTPAWRELPKETRSTLTSLLARLILEHAQASNTVSRTEVNHDL